MRLTWRRGGLEGNVLTDLSLEHHSSDYIDQTRTCKGYNVLVSGARLNGMLIEGQDVYTYKVQLCCVVLFPESTSTSSLARHVVEGRSDRKNTRFECKFSNTSIDAF